MKSIVQRTFKTIDHLQQYSTKQEQITTIERQKQTQKQRNLLYGLWKLGPERRYIPFHTALPCIHQRKKEPYTVTAAFQ